MNDEKVCQVSHLIQAKKIQIVEPCYGLSRVNYCKWDSTINHQFVRLSNCLDLETTKDKIYDKIWMEQYTLYFWILFNQFYAITGTHQELKVLKCDYHYQKIFKKFKW